MKDGVGWDPDTESLELVHFSKGNSALQGRQIFPAVLCLPEDKVCLASGMVCRISGVSFVAGSPTALWADFSMEHVANVFSIFVQGRRSSHCERKRGRQPISQVRAEGAAGAGE